MNHAKLLTAAAICTGLALGTPLPARASDTNPKGADTAPVTPGLKLPKPYSAEASK